MDWTNTHYYDNNISEELICKVMGHVITVDNECFNLLRKDLVRLNIDNIGLKYYDQMILSHKNSDGSNYDPINKINAIDLLYIIYTISRDNDIVLTLLIEQLHDMKTGFCPQGRSIRLLQILYLF